MTRFIGGTVGGISGLFLLWLWFAEEEKKNQRTLNMLFFASVLTSTAMVLGPNFKPFKYFCASNVRVRTQKVGDLNVCIVEARHDNFWHQFIFFIMVLPNHRTDNN